MPRVEIYSTPTCSFCKMSKEYFKSKNIEYSDYNVAEDAVRRQEMIEKTGAMSVPVIVIDGKTVIIGFNKSKINAALEIQ